MGSWVNDLECIFSLGQIVPFLQKKSLAKETGNLIQLNSTYINISWYSQYPVMFMLFLRLILLRNVEARIWTYQCHQNHVYYIWIIKMIKINYPDLCIRKGIHNFYDPRPTIPFSIYSLYLSTCNCPGRRNLLRKWRTWMWEKLVYPRKSNNVYYKVTHPWLCSIVLSSHLFSQNSYEFLVSVFTNMSVSV